jgi:hypothetical protein
VSVLGVGRTETGSRLPGLLGLGLLALGMAVGVLKLARARSVRSAETNPGSVLSRCQKIHWALPLPM